MTEITVKTGTMNSALSKLNSISNEINRNADEIDCIMRSLSFQVKSRAQINAQLLRLEKTCKNNSAHIKRMSTALSDAVALYSGTEKRIIGNPKSSNVNPAKPNKNRSIIENIEYSIGNKIARDILNQIKKYLSKYDKYNLSSLTWLLLSGQLIKSSDSTKSIIKIFGKDVEMTSDYQFFKRSGYIDVDNLSAGGKFHGFRDNTKLSYKWLSFASSINVGDFEADGSVGNIINSSFNAEGTLLDIKGKGTIGNDRFNVYHGTELEAGSAKAENEKRINISSFSDFDIEMGLGAEANAVTATDSIGTTIFGIRYETGASVGIGAGKSSKLKITNDGIRMEIGGADGFEGGLYSELDWSNFGLKANH